jgi:hypothetical protein
MPTNHTLPTLVLVCLLSGGTAWSADPGGGPGGPGGRPNGPPGNQGQPPPDMGLILHDVFTAADSDGTGSLNLTEFTAAIAALKAKMMANAPANAPAPPADPSTDAQRAARLSKVFAAADANGDGRLNFPEFTVAVRMLAPPHRPPPGQQGQGQPGQQGQGQPGQSGN